jgi:hypothetical protein
VQLLLLANAKVLIIHGELLQLRVSSHLEWKIIIQVLILEPLTLVEDFHKAVL